MKKLSIPLDLPPEVPASKSYSGFQSSKHNRKEEAAPGICSPTPRNLGRPVRSTDETLQKYEGFRLISCNTIVTPPIRPVSPAI